MGKRRETRTPSNVEYLDFYTDVVRLLTDSGYEFPRMGSLLPPAVIDAMNTATVRREKAAEFAAWLLREQRRLRVPTDERDPMGEETISPHEVAA